MSGLFDKRKKRKLYEQWVEKSGLPEENIPDEIRMPDTMPLPQAIPSGGVSLDGIMEDLERRYLLKALIKYDHPTGFKPKKPSFCHTNGGTARSS